MAVMAEYDELASLRAHVERLGREHARHALAVSAHKGRADQQESRAVRAEKQLARFARQAEEYDQMATRVRELEAALRRHMKPFTEGRTLQVCGGCLTDVPCPDAGLIAEEPSP